MTGVGWAVSLVLCEWCAALDMRWRFCDAKLGAAGLGNEEESAGVVN